MINRERLHSNSYFHLRPGPEGRRLCTDQAYQAPKTGILLAPRILRRRQGSDRDGGLDEGTETLTCSSLLSVNVLDDDER